MDPQSRSNALVGVIMVHEAAVQVTCGVHEHKRLVVVGPVRAVDLVRLSSDQNTARNARFTAERVTAHQCEPNFVSKGGMRSLEDEGGEGGASSRAPDDGGCTLLWSVISPLWLVMT